MILPIAPARRAAVCAALHKAASSDAAARLLMHEHRSIVIDDLCRLEADLWDISDADLACVAAETPARTSDAARVVYAARILLRAAGLPNAGQASKGRPAPHFLRRESLRGALEEIARAGIFSVLVPRALLTGIYSPEPQPPFRGWVARMLAAVYIGGKEHLVALLGAAPYAVDPADLSIVGSDPNVGGDLLVTSLREALVKAAGTLRTAQARDAARAALTACDAATAQTQGSTFSLAGAGAGIYALDLEGQDPDYPALLAAATSADRVWSRMTDPPLPSVQVATLLDGQARRRLAEEIELVPYGCEEQQHDAAQIRFDDAPGAAVSLETFTAQVGRASESAKRERTGRLTVHVVSSVARAVSSYALEAALAADTRRTPQAEESSIVKAPPMTFSASRLNAYVKCPRRWFYDYLCSVLEDPPSIHSAYGRVVHVALEALHREIRVPSRHEPDAILAKLLLELDAAFGRGRSQFQSQLEYEVCRCRARRTAEQYVRWLSAQAAGAPFEIIHVEAVQRERFGGHEFVGFVDRVDRPLGGGPVTIFDYKTGRIDADPHEYLKKVRSGDEAQLALYYAMRRAANDDVARIALVSIRDPRDEVWILALDVVDETGKAAIERQAVDGVLRAACSREDLEASLAALIARCDFLTQQGVDRFPAGEDPPCNFCAYARSCRERPADGERIFAR